MTTTATMSKCLNLKICLYPLLHNDTQTPETPHQSPLEDAHYFEGKRNQVCILPVISTLYILRVTEWSIRPFSLYVTTLLKMNRDGQIRDINLLQPLMDAGI